MSYSKLAQSCIIAPWAALIIPILLMIFVDSTADCGFGSNFPDSCCCYLLLDKSYTIASSEQQETPESQQTVAHTVTWGFAIAVLSIAPVLFGEVFLPARTGFELSD